MNPRFLLQMNSIGARIRRRLIEVESRQQLAVN
jgi:hypothetical protein